MKKILTLLTVALVAVVGCSSEQYPAQEENGTQLVVVKHKNVSNASSTVKKHHRSKKKHHSSGVDAAQMGS